jgi:HEAT repeat protein
VSYPVRASLAMVILLNAALLVPEGRAQESDIDAFVRKLDESIAGFPSEQKLEQAKKSVPTLIEALSQDSTRWTAINLLGRIGDPAAIPSLIKMTERKDAASAALRALAPIGGSEVVPVLLEGLTADLAQNEERQAMFLQRDLVESLGAIGDNRAVNPLIRILRTNKGPTYAAARALGRFRDPRVRDCLRTAIAETPDWEVYRAARLSLERIAKQELFDMDNEKLRSLVILAVAKDPDPAEGAEEYVRRRWEEYRKSLEKAEASQGKDGKYGHLAQSGPETLDEFAPQILIRRSGQLLVKRAMLPQGPDPVVELLMEYLVNGKINSDAVERAQQVIIRIGRPAVPALLIGLQRGDIVLKYNCAKCLAEIGDPIAINDLEKYAAAEPIDPKGVQDFVRKLKAKQANKPKP